MKNNQSGACRCDACGARFCGLTAFDLHRTGEYATTPMRSTRRCLTAAEMHLRGMRKGSTGVWASGKSNFTRSA
jgi:hypothetical protein